MRLEQMNVLELKIALEEEILLLSEKAESIKKKRYEKLSKEDVVVLNDIYDEIVELKSVLRKIGEFER